ncbi:MAG: hypothetical protein PUF12_07575 [Thermoflexaceae bacterium]|nr:hypothetical protein [Thermoflexaceae bacterium]
MKKYRIDKTKNIGNVIFVVEGGRPDTGGTELRLLKKIFTDILEYEVQELRRGSEEFIAHGQHSQFHVFALNLPKNQLTQLTQDSIDKLFARLKEDFHLKPEDCPVFYLYDRDVLSYHRNELRKKYVMKYTDPYGTDDGYQGQLLLSYPAIESYLLSCIIDETVTHSSKLGREAKTLLTNEICPDDCADKTDIHMKTVDLVFSSEISEAGKRLIHSIKEMDNGLETMGLQSYDLDNLAPTLLGVYDYQQQKYDREDVFSLLSLVGMALLELGVITECDEEYPQ